MDIFLESWIQAATGRMIMQSKNKKSLSQETIFHFPFHWTTMKAISAYL